MATRRTLDDLLKKVIEARELTDFAKRVGMSPETLRRMLRGIGTRNHRGTILAIATELGVSEKVVRNAIEATRENASGD